MGSPRGRTFVVAVALVGALCDCQASPAADAATARGAGNRGNVLLRDSVITAVALIGGTLINPDAAPVRDAVVVLRDGRVVCAGPGAACPVPAGTETRDISGAFVGPGLVDAHVHYSQTGWVDGRPDAADVRRRYPYDSVVAAMRDHPERFDRAYLCSGVTSVFDVGGYPWTLSMAQAHETTLTAPRMVAAGPLLSTIDFWLNLPFERQFVFMRDDSTVRTAVRALARMGASAVKVWYIQVPDTLQPTMRHRLEVAGDEAHKVGLPLIVHATELARAKEALAAGTNVLVHDVDDAPVDSEFIQLARQHHAVLIPTIVVLTGYGDVLGGKSPGYRYPLDCVDAGTRQRLATPLDSSLRVAPARLARLTTFHDQNSRNVGRLAAAGVALAMGTDAGNPGTAHGPSVYAEMEAMQAAGMSAAAVFASATQVSARAMGRERDLGSLEAGKLADAVVFDADPTRDIANARRVRLVVRGGKVYSRSELLPGAVAGTR